MKRRSFLATAIGALGAGLAWSLGRQSAKGNATISQCVPPDSVPLSVVRTKDFLMFSTLVDKEGMQGILHSVSCTNAVPFCGYPAGELQLVGGYFCRRFGLGRYYVKLSIEVRRSTRMMYVGGRVTTMRLYPQVDFHRLLGRFWVMQQRKVSC